MFDALSDRFDGIFKRLRSRGRRTATDHALLLIDHQYLQLLTLRSHEAAQVISNATSVAKAAKIFKVPTLLTTASSSQSTIATTSTRSTIPGPPPYGRSSARSPDSSASSRWCIRRSINPRSIARPTLE